MTEPAPDLLKAFISFCEKAAEDFADFELVREPVRTLTALLDNKDMAEFFQVGQHGTGSLIALWRESKDLDEAFSPVVWLSSEGFPNSVFASSFAEFLSLLPYGTGFIYDVLSNYYFYQDDPDLQPSPEEKFTHEEIRSYLGDSRERYKGHSAFVNWLRNEAKIEVASDPLAVIKGAIASHPDLKSWLQKQT